MRATAAGMGIGYVSVTAARPRVDTAQSRPVPGMAAQPAAAFTPVHARWGLIQEVLGSICQYFECKWGWQAGSKHGGHGGQKAVAALAKFGGRVSLEKGAGASSVLIRVDKIGACGDSP